MLAKSTITRHLLRFLMLPLVSAVWLGVAPAAYADEPVQGGGTFTISFTPVPEPATESIVRAGFITLIPSTGNHHGRRHGEGIPG